MVIGAGRIVAIFGPIEARQGIILGKSDRHGSGKRPRKPEFGHIIAR
jgi:hypothetical protein